MVILQHLSMGFGIALDPGNLMCIIMCQLIGVSVGILPGINASMAVCDPYSIIPRFKICKHLRSSII